MRIGIQTWGSEGDIRPFIALAAGLSAAGHQVTLVITDVDDRNYTAQAERFGFQVRHVATPVVSSHEAFESIGLSIIQEKNPFKQALIITRQLFNPVVEPMYEAAEALCAESDMVVGHFILYPLGIAAERQRVPNACVMFAPVTIPSRYKGPNGMPAFGQWGNMLEWWLMEKVIDWKLLPDVNSLRARAGLGPASGMMSKAWASSYLNLLAVSPVLCQAQPDWGERFRVCGFFNLPEKGTPWEIPPDLREFLRSGSPPVYMTFGSMTPKGGGDSQGLDKMVELFTQAAAEADCRAIIQVPEYAVEDYANANTQKDRIFFVSSLPHREVFPHCAAVVHHGGAGTTQTTMLSAVPSVIVAHIAEQTFWASELRALGIAPKALGRRDLTSQMLARRIRVVIGSPDMKERAGRLGSAMQDENGVARAVEEIERWAAAGFRIS